MSNKKKFFVLVLAAVVVALNIYIFSYRTPASGVFGFFVEMKADHEDVIQLYYGENTAFQEANSEKIAYGSWDRPGRISDTKDVSAVWGYGC